VDIEAAAIETEEDIIQFRIAGSHFLWRMVRRIVGALVKVGAREITLADFRHLLDGRCEEKFDVAAWTAPASGLFLEEIRYNDRR
jgi:tRNA pseudouridine38-40 synthase